MCVRWVPGRPRPSFGENAAAPAASLSLWEQRVSRRGRGPPAGAEGAARTVPPARPLHGHSPTARAPQGTALPPAPWSRREDVELSRDPGFLKRAQALGPRGESASPVQIRVSHSVLVPVLCADATARRAAARSLSRGARGEPAEGADSPATCFPVLVAAVLVFKAGPTRRGARGKRHVRGRVLREQPSGDPWEHMGGGAGTMGRSPRRPQRERALSPWPSACPGLGRARWRTVWREQPTLTLPCARWPSCSSFEKMSLFPLEI